MPSPVGLVVKNGWNGLSLMSTGMPVPLFRTRISTASPASMVVTFSVGTKPASPPSRARLVAAEESVAEDVQEHPRHVLRIDLERGDAVAEILFQCDVEGLILGAGVVVGEVQRLMSMAVADAYFKLQEFSGSGTTEPAFIGLPGLEGCWSAVIDPKISLA